MHKNRYERRELSHKWEDIRPLLKDSESMLWSTSKP